MFTFNLPCSFVFLLLFVACVPIARGQTCAIKTSAGVMDQEFEKIFTQDGPGRGLEPNAGAGWTGADSTYSILLPNGDSAFFFSDSYIAESPARTGDGTVTRTANGMRQRQVNCPAPLCNPPTSLFFSKNSIVVREKQTGRLRTLTGPPDANGFSTSFFKLPAGSDPTH